MSSYDDGEDIPTPGEDMTADQVRILQFIRQVPDATVRRVLMAVFVIDVLHGRTGR